MARHSPADLKARIPIGWDAMWIAIRELDKHGPWTVRMVAERCGGDTSSVRDFVRRLVAARIAEQRGSEYGLRERPVETPRLRRDGTAVPPCKQQQMWTAMRSLAQFGAAELAMAASTDEAKVEEVAALNYLVRLSAAGYLLVVSPAKKTGGRAIYRLKPAMNTGPNAPQVMRTRFVWDPNERRVMGGPSKAEEVAS
jgi:hypothetical protein